jgi:hypothetical protein
VKEGSALKIRYDAPKNSRIKKGTCKYKGKRVFYFHGVECKGYWWHEERNKWIKFEEWHNEGDICTCNDNVNNLKQLIRHIKRHNYLPKGTEFILVSMFQGLNIYVTI